MRGSTTPPRVVDGQKHAKACFCNLTLPSPSSRYQKDRILPDIIYKYTDEAGAQKILANRTLRFARPSEMNDPFDVYIDDLFGIDMNEFFEESVIQIFDLMQDDPNLCASKFGVSLAEAEAISALLKKAPDAEREKLKNIFRNLDMAKFDPEFEKIRENVKKSRDHFVKVFSSYGIFCATKNYNNLLMWAHYADKHKGVVFGFKADLEKDSFLRLMEPVRYSDERPYVIQDTNSEMKSEDSGLEKARKATQRLLHTKSTQWSYEEELRLAIPDQVKPDEVASFLKFHPHELVEVYLGYRMKDESINKIIDLAKTLNPKVQAYSAKLSKRKYALDFERIV